MKLYEFQAKELFQKYGIPIPRGILFEADAFDEIADSLEYPVLLKSQVLMGGRGKAGLIRFAENKDEAKELIEGFRSSPYRVERILAIAEDAVEIASELYLSVTWDPVAATALVIACAEGGVEIEELAKTAPEKIIREAVDVDRGLLPFQASHLAYQLGLEGSTAKAAAKVILNLYKVFDAYDAELAEINPLFITKDGSVVAGDGKLMIDDTTIAKHPEYAPGRDYYDSDAEYEAAQDGIPYLQFDGDISLMCAGAGLTTTIYDLINDEGGKVANYLEFGGPNYRRAQRAMELCLKNESKVILVVTFGTIARADVMAQGLVDAIKELKPTVPIVTCIRGTNEEEAVKILKSAGLEPIFDTEEAVRKAVVIAASEEGKGAQA